MKKYLIITLCLVCAVCAAKEPQPKYLFSEADFPQLTTSYNAQGMAIFENWMFSLHDKGSCAVFNLAEKSLAGEFRLASAGQNNHCNVAFFGSRRYEAGDKFPLLYVSQANGSPIKEIGLPQTDSLSHLLFVERVLTDGNGVPCGTKIVKLIHYQPKFYVSRLWAQDPADPDYIYCYGNVVGNGRPGNRVAIKKFRYPQSEEFLVSLTDKDVVESFFFDELMSFGERGPQENILQGAIIRNGIFYLPIGAGDVRYPAELFYADLKNRGRYGHIDFTAAVNAEPEDVDFWGDKLVCGFNKWGDDTCPFYYFELKDLKKAMTTKKDEVTDRYSIVILGDTHFDAEPAEKYHSCYNEKTEWLNRVQRQEFARNGEMWRERCPKMVVRASRLIGADTRMVFQTGDLIQGDCGNPEVHKQMLGDVMDNFKRELGGLPFVTVVGNHDVRGTGAKQAYHQFMPERMSRELGKKITGTTFSFNIGPDAFIVVDFNSPDIEKIRACLKATEGARYTFILSHGPVFPYDAANCKWFLLGADKYKKLRRELRSEMAKRDVICLCGHTHKVELADWFGFGGRITQMTMNSVWSSDGLAKLKTDSDSPAQYGTLRKGAIKDDGTPTVDESKLFDEYRPGLKRYYHGKGAGSFKLFVSSHGVYVDFYGGDSENVTKSFVLR